MGQFGDERDARRPSEFPRISGRYRTSIETVWFPPSRRAALRGGPKGVEVQVLDLSIGGALVLAPTHAGLRPGAKLKMVLDDIAEVVVVRNVQPSSNPSYSYYGVAFFFGTGNLEAKVVELVVELRSAP